MRYQDWEEPLADRHDPPRDDQDAKEAVSISDEQLDAIFDGEDAVEENKGANLQLLYHLAEEIAEETYNPSDGNLVQLKKMYCR